MVLKFSNLAFYTPTALTLTLKGTGTVTKALADVSIAGNNLTYNPTSGEKSTLGSGTVYAQVKVETATDYLKSEVLRMTAADLDKTLESEITLCEDFGTEIALLQANKVSKSGDTMTDGAATIIRHNAPKGEKPASTQSKYVQFSGSGTTGNTGLLINQITNAGNITSLVRANSLLGTGYCDMRVLQYADGTGVLQFYQGADSTLNVPADGPYEIYHKGNLPISTAIKMDVISLNSGNTAFTVPTNSRHFLFFASTNCHGVAELQAISTGATNFYFLTTTSNMTVTTTTNKATFNNGTTGAVDMLVVTVRGNQLTSTTV